MAINNVVTALKQKLDGSFTTPTYFSTQQRYVKGLLNSHNNNLEEQSILGVDCITTSWIDSNTKIKYITKKFYDDNNFFGSGYYILFEEDYSKATASGGFYILNNTLVFPDNVDVSKTEYITGTDYVKLLDSDLYIYNLQELSMLINPYTTGELIKKDTLCYRTNLQSDSDIILPNDDLIVSVKLSTVFYEDGKFITKEIISNNLT